MLFMAAVVFGTAELTGGFGFRSLGGEVMGGKKYAYIFLAIMGYFGVTWNFANFFGLPILIGAGHEYGVFMVHRYLEARRDPRRTWQRWDALHGQCLGQVSPAVALDCEEDLQVTPRADAASAASGPGPCSGPQIGP